MRQNLQAKFQTTLPRFDLMAQLERAPQGLKMSELSQRMMVTGGNVTGITDGLEKEGLVVREVDPTDRRVFRVRLTAEGQTQFRRMAAEHEQWVIELFDGHEPKHKNQLVELLGELKQHVSRSMRRPRVARSRLGARPQHFLWRREGRVGVITLNRPERKNPLTFESYAELRDLVPRPCRRTGGARHRPHRRRRQFLLRRRRARDHRPADAHGRRRPAANSRA